MKILSLKSFGFFWVLAGLLLAGNPQKAWAIPEFSTRCHDGVLQDAPPNQKEHCDDFNNNENDDCRSDCKLNECGDGILHTISPSDPEATFNEGFEAAPLEGCDDGDTTGNDGCSNTCAIEALCGNGAVDPGEECDDSNTTAGDGCNAGCITETAEIVCGDFDVDPGEECDDGDVDDCGGGDTCDENCVRIDCDLADCGNGTVSFPEECDDMNTMDGDGCSATCEIEPNFCGNGILETNGTTEECDDGNTADGDGCSATCTIEAGSCGDGIKDAGEECDDGNSYPKDTCNGCKLHPDAATAGVVCGDGTVTPPETCDDSNTDDGDGCSNSCQIEGGGGPTCGNGIPESLECGETGTCPEDCGGAGGGTTGGGTTGGGPIPTPTPVVSGDDCSCNTNPMAFPAANFLGLLGLWMALGVGYISTRFKRK